MPSGLSPELVSAIRLRIADPRKRTDLPQGEPGGIVDDPGELAKLFDPLPPGTPDPLRMVMQQMEAWGQKMPPMHVTHYGDGSVSASSDEPAGPLARPATEDDFRRLEHKIGHAMPQDLRDLYSIANGGFGPGFGPGLYSLERIGQEYDDLCRRGPDYTGRSEWPRQLLPLTDNIGAVSYDLDRGVIVGFDEHCEDRGLTLEEGFSVLNADLETWLRDWLEAAS